MNTDRDTHPAPSRSLLRSIHDGSAGVVSRILASLVAGLLLLALACVGAAMVGTLWWSRWNWDWGFPRHIRVNDEEMFSCLLVAGALYVPVLLWVWGRFRQGRPTRRAVILTVVLWLLAIPLCVATGRTYDGDTEACLTGAVLCLATAASVLLHAGPSQGLRPGARRSLLGSIRDGTASLTDRIMASLTASLFLTALACVATVVAGTLYWSTTPWTQDFPRNIRADDDPMMGTFPTAAGLLLLLLPLIWGRPAQRRSVLVAIAATIGLGLLTVLLCVMAGLMFAGSPQVLMAAMICMATAVTVLVWVRCYRRCVAGRALYDRTGVVNLRCPECRYSMVGLKEARCPECGREYTLDELVSRQAFYLPRGRHDAAGD